MTTEKRTVHLPNGGLYAEMAWDKQDYGRIDEPVAIQIVASGARFSEICRVEAPFAQLRGELNKS
ncbi:hypothetical protein T265_10734 [Opisthorchis viverrini]|uniref:Uncharacterized protein n=1 Tax=Opisthorchis viverrini TaxID=6198 RepID=A0A074Z5J2_OPIVI|nr:hypothetical protein T265_10734 [Opisthorchis viverrini]KER20797.1 hypothetical protein T265_10734 [Opisthorchis viverrini]